MTLPRTLRNIGSRAVNHGIREAVSHALRQAQSRVLETRFPETTQSGENVYSRDWDVLVVLDSARYDLVSSIEDEYWFLHPVEELDSVGTVCQEWMDRTFTEAPSEAVSQTAYIAGNPSADHLNADQFRVLEDVWRDGWDDDFGGVPPRAVTDRAISVWKNTTTEKMIVHYMQPHVPFHSAGFHSGFAHPHIEPTDPETDEAWGREISEGVWERLRDGELDRETVWEAYRENLEWVMDDVELLIQNIDAESVAITSDHGNAAGEHGFWGHRAATPVPELQRVPWIETSGEDLGEYTPGSR